MCERGKMLNWVWTHIDGKKRTYILYRPHISGIRIRQWQWLLPALSNHTTTMTPLIQRLSPGALVKYVEVYFWNIGISTWLFDWILIFLTLHLQVTHLCSPCEWIDGWTSLPLGRGPSGNLQPPSAKISSAVFGKPWSFGVSSSGFFALGWKIRMVLL